MSRMSSKISTGFARLVVAACISFPLLAQHYAVTTFSIPGANGGMIGNGINDQGDVTGSYGYIADKRTIERGFVRYADGSLLYPLIDPNDRSNFTAPYGINNAGVIAGYYAGSQGYNGFLLANGTYTDFQVFGSLNTQLLAINVSGDLAGAYGPITPTANGFVTVAGAPVQVDIAGALYTHVTGLADDGSAVGFAQLDGQIVSFVRGPKGKVKIFQVPNAGPAGTVAQGINSEAQLIVGYYYGATGGIFGFVYHYSKALNELAPDAGGTKPAIERVDATTVNASAQSGYTFVQGVNSLGVIVGGWSSSKVSLGFIGTPIQ